MNSIMVGFDGTAASAAAVAWAADRAAQGETRVDIVMIAGDMFSDDLRIDAALIAAERHVLDRAPDCEVTSRRVAGHMPAALFAQARLSDLLVVGAHSGRALRAALSGWLPLRIAAGSPVPVVIVPEHWSASDGPVVVGVDDDGSSTQAVALAAGHAQATGEALIVVHAWQRPTPQMDGSVSLIASPIRVRAEHSGVLRSAVQQVHILHPDLTVQEALIRDNPSSALASRARGAAMLVLGTHGRGILAGGLFGSVGQDVLSGATVPVCVVPQAAGR